METENLGRIRHQTTAIQSHFNSQTEIQENISKTEKEDFLTLEPPKKFIKKQRRDKVGGDAGNAQQSTSQNEVVFNAIVKSKEKGWGEGPSHKQVFGRRGNNTWLVLIRGTHRKPFHTIRLTQALVLQ